MARGDHLWFVCRRSSYPRSMRKSSVATCASLAARGRRPLSIPEARKPSVSIMPGPSEFTRILRGPSSLLDITRSNAQTAETSPFPLDDSTTIAISDSPASASKIDCNSLAVHPQVGSTNEANLYTATLGRLFTGIRSEPSLQDSGGKTGASRFGQGVKESTGSAPSVSHSCSDARSS